MGGGAKFLKGGDIPRFDPFERGDESPGGESPVTTDQTVLNNI